MLTDVSPTRMELLKLKRKLGIARRGHKLLKDKLDELVRVMIILVKETASARDESDRLIRESRAMLDFASFSVFPGSTAASLICGDNEIAAAVTTRPLLNLRIPVFTIPEDAVLKTPAAFAQTSAASDEAAELFSIALKKLILLAAKEKEIRLIADEIEKTRRRVNALEYILIPGITETIKGISMKLEETERNTLVRLMRIKDTVRAPVSYSSGDPGFSDIFSGE